MSTTFNACERRVLGVLIEKSMTQPEYYPMTANSIVTASNQRSNRHPVMDIDEVTVQSTLDQLRQRGFVEQIFPAPGARTNRFKHKIEASYGWGPRERALMAELLLRGPQTAGELRSRASRMAAFDSLDIVINTLDALGQTDPPFVRPLPREPGRSASRYDHLLYPPDEATSSEAPATAASPTPAIPAAQTPAAPATAPDTLESAQFAAGTETVASLAQQLQELRKDMADLHELLAEFDARLRRIEGPPDPE